MKVELGEGLALGVAVRVDVNVAVKEFGVGVLVGEATAGQRTFTLSMATV